MLKNCHPDEILQKSRTAYEKLESYQAEGEVISHIINGEIKAKARYTFVMQLKKPNLYRVTWTQKIDGVMVDGQAGAVWNDGTQAYVYMGIMKAYSKVISDEMALASGAGISGGVMHTVLPLFFPAIIDKEQHGQFLHLVQPDLKGMEKVGGDNCYVISGSSQRSKRETYWISSTDFLLRKSSRSYEPPDTKPGGESDESLEMSEKQLRQTAEVMGMEATPENIQAMKEMIERAMLMAKDIDIQGESIEYYRQTSSLDLPTKGFVFVPPEGTVLKKFLFDDMLKMDAGDIMKNAEDTMRRAEEAIEAHREWKKKWAAQKKSNNGAKKDLDKKDEIIEEQQKRIKENNKRIEKQNKLIEEARKRVKELRKKAQELE